jgi:DNA-binding SARP family transcriptional activator
MTDMRIRVLGPVEIWKATRRLPLGPPKQRCLVAALAITPGRPVTLETLAYRIWGDQRPMGVNNNIRTYVARLRRLLKQELPGAVTISRWADGYVLDIDRHRIDLWWARRLIEEAGAAGDDTTAAALYSRALCLWEAHPLAGLPGVWAERTRTALRQERVSALIHFFEIELRLGGHERMIGPLWSEAGENPLDESLAGLLMVCLYRSHRYAAALAVYQRIKTDLADELGIDPGPGLRSRYAEILRNDPRLDFHPA